MVAGSFDTGNTRGGPAFRVWPPVSIGVPLLAGYALTAWLGEPRILDPSWSRPMGVVLLVAFAGWNGWALLLMRLHRTGLMPGQETRTIIDEGPFGVSRNPLYVGLVVAHIGLALLWTSLWAVVLLPFAIAGLRWGAIAPEERYLRARFGEEYIAYCARVRRWL